ncbi:MAG: 16S rRNA processing protein RimM [Bacteriovorax sp. MedPE-SWde]|nr:MAG: 16S rRNA processing protein RimM [Bacteriovorax sp. MedPE-SWde]
MDKDSLIILGVCNKPHGIRGGFTFVLENSQDSVLSKGTSVYLFPSSPASSISSEGEEHKIEKISFGNKTIAYLKDVTDRNVTESMIPFEIKFPRDQFPEAEEGEFYIADLVGIEVLEFGTDELVGKVSDYYDNSVQTILTIRGAKQSFDIPFVENFVPKVDVEARRIWVVIPKLI